jgi:photoactive yellow protein
VEALTQAQMDSLSFGVIGIDAHDVVHVYNKTEAECSGFKERTALGRFCFVDVAPCLSNSFFKERIDTARQAGALDIRFSFVGDFSDSERELTIRAQSGKDGGCWIFIQRV